MRTAAQQGEDPFILMAQWRRANRFLVEQPALAAVTVREEEAEARDGAALAPDVPYLGYMSEVNVASIPLTQLRDYASALADAPIHRLPIHRLLIDDAPVHRLPIHRLPIHRLPIHRLDIPGGWTELLAGTPFAAASSCSASSVS